MNKQQAINILKNIEQSLDDYCGLNDEAKTAFRMAITALELFGNSEQLPSVQPKIEERTAESAQNVLDGDLTSRQAAIDEIEYELEMINSALDSITLDFNARERLRQRKGEAREILNSIQQLPSAQPEQTRIFVELVVEYPDPELCTYKEYRGKPYYSIKYIENGETYVGYGTYNPKVLSQYLKKYFIPSAQPEQRWIPCSDCERKCDKWENLKT